MHFFTSIFSGSRANKVATSTVFTKDGSINLKLEEEAAAAKKAEEEAAAAKNAEE